MLTVFAVTVLAYLFGSVPFGYLIARAKGVDIFKEGSGNIGATNVGRVLGRKFGVLVFVLDFLKGVGPVALALWTTSKSGGDEGLPEGTMGVAAGLAAFLGHLFPVYLGFRGGKGVATGAGVVAVLFPMPTLVAFAAWLVVVSATRAVSLGSIVAVFVVATTYLLQRGACDPRDPRTLFCIAAGALIVARHRANMVRLWRGTENQIREVSIMNPFNRSLHVLSLGLWFGMSVFFSFVVALSVFRTMEDVSQQQPRPTWFPLAKEFAHRDAEIDGPKEQGTRAAGAVVGPLFDVYYPLSGLLGLTALASSLAWTREGRVHRLRFWLLLLAVITVLAGWPIERRVHDLRPARNEATDAYLLDPSDAKRSEMRAARGEFGKWHTVSLLLNLGAVALVTIAMGMAGSLPTRRDTSSAVAPKA
jgi:acyl-phosphate glycerol 3-phosphate acyltransferase